MTIIFVCFLFVFLGYTFFTLLDVLNAAKLEGWNEAKAKTSAPVVAEPPAAIKPGDDATNSHDYV